MPSSRTPHRGISTRQAATKTPSGIASPLTPGWTKARPEMFTPVVVLRPVNMENTPSPFKNRRMTRRSSLYVMASKMKKSLVTSPKNVQPKEAANFKKPVTRVRRQSAIPRPQTVRSPTMTRARRASVYVSAARNNAVIKEEPANAKASPEKLAKSLVKSNKHTGTAVATKTTSVRHKSRSPSRSPSKSSKKKTPVAIKTPLQARRALRESTQKASAKKHAVSGSPQVPQSDTPQSAKVSPRTISSILSKKVVIQVAQLGSPLQKNGTPKTPIKAARILGKVSIRMTPRQTRKTHDGLKQGTPLTSTPVKSTKKRKADGPPPVSEIRQTKSLRNSEHDESVFPTPEGEATVNGIDVSSLKQAISESRELSRSKLSVLDQTTDDGWMQWCTIL